MKSDLDQQKNLRIIVNGSTVLLYTNEKKEVQFSQSSLCQRLCLNHFERLNAVAALAHLVNAVLTLALPGTEDKLIPVYDSYASWTSMDNTDITVENCPINHHVMSFNRTNGPESFLVNPRAKKETFTLSLQWLIFSFHFLSFLFQGGIPVSALVYDHTLTNETYVKNIKQRGVNIWRFVEYSVSATLMLVCIALVSGIDEFNALFSIVVLTSVTMILGLVVELLFDDVLFDLKDIPQKFLKTLKERRQHILNVGWGVHVTAWVTIVSAYGGIIIKYYVLSLQESDEGIEPPWWVTLAIFMIMALYLIFGGIQLVQLYWKQQYLTRGASQKQSMVSKNIQVELLYIFNSLITKTILGWIIILNLTDLIDDGKIMCRGNSTL